MLQWSKSNDSIGTYNRGVPAESGLCTLCLASCKGKCETWLSSMVGRELLYPRNFGECTAGASNITSLGVGYHALRIQGYAHGAQGLGKGMTNNADHCLFANASVKTKFGASEKTKCRVPIMTGALGSTFIAANYWTSFAVGAALCGFPIVVGENVVGVDRESIINKGKIKKAPELDRRIESFFRYYDGYGAIIVQLNVEGFRHGVAEYIMNKYGNKVIIELKWGQGAKDIGGEIQVKTIEYAKFLKDRGYLIDPDPYNRTVERAYKNRAVSSFARHSRLGNTDKPTPEDVREEFMNAVGYLRKIGFNKITLKTGAYGMEALAMAIRYSADAELDLLTIDGAGGGTGMSPWNMMQHWGIPSLELHSKAYEYCTILKNKGLKVPDISFAGGFAREDHLFKAIALGAPFTKLVCLGRAPMIPGFLGSNIEGVFFPERRAELNGHWIDLPSSVTAHGKYPEEIFAGWERVKNKVGEEEMKNIPFGAIALYTMVDKLACGLQQFMAGARKFELSKISRDDLVSANRETADVSGIPYMLDALDDKAHEVLNS